MFHKQAEHRISRVLLGFLVLISILILVVGIIFIVLSFVNNAFTSFIALLGIVLTLGMLILLYNLGDLTYNKLLGEDKHEE